MLLHNRAIIVICSLNLAACSWLGAPPPAPNTTIPDSFMSANESYQNIENLPYLAWWQNFHDDKLNQLMESGLANNNSIAIAQSNLEQAQGQLKQVQLSWIPFVNIFAGYSSNPALGNPGVLYGILPQYSINIFKTYKEQQQAKYNVAVATAMVDGMRLALIGQISASYFTLIAEEENLNLLNALDADLQKLIDLRHQEIKIGIKDNIDIAELLSNEKIVKAQIATTRYNLILTQNSLRYLLNQNPGSIDNKNNFAKLDFIQFQPGGLPANVLQNRPDIIIAENQIKAAYSGVGVAYGNLFPAIQLDNFTGGANLNDPDYTPYNAAGYNDAYLNWGIKPSTFGQIEAQKGAYQANIYNYIQTVRKILKDVDTDFAANRLYKQSYLDMFKAWQDLDKKYQLQTGLYNTGILAYPDLLLSKIAVDNLAISLNQSKLKHAMSLVMLYQDLAGGYKYQSESKPIRN